MGSTAAKKYSERYWDNFMNQCIQTTQKVINDDWIALEDIQDMDPSVIESIPAMSILAVLVDSVNDKNVGKHDIKWNVDGGFICTKEGRPQNDGIIHLLSKNVFELKQLLLKNKKRSSDVKEKYEDNVELLMAMFCSNKDNSTETLKAFMKKAAAKQRQDGGLGRRKKRKDDIDKDNIIIRTKINSLVLSILRLKPYQDRMSQIYNGCYDFGSKRIETTTGSVLVNSLADDLFKNWDSGHTQNTQADDNSDVDGVVNKEEEEMEEKDGGGEDSDELSDNATSCTLPDLEEGGCSSHNEDNDDNSNDTSSITVPST